jgi:acyl-CoA synthetase (AMP-forming)/AMP-acid ligase II
LRAHEGTAAALLDAGGSELSFSDVLTRASGIAAALRAAGVERHERVAIVTRNGTEAALAFLGASLAAVAAPLNPAYRRPEMEFALKDLPARVLLTDGSSAAAVEAATACGIPDLRIETAPLLGEFDEPAPTDVALVLHTSGTTGAPKRVPLTHGNLAASARNIASGLGLEPGDRCLNVMPLFHIHGLVGAVLASLSAGAGVICTPGFDGFRMNGWLRELRPTWYSAVPTMHQALLARSGPAGSSGDSLRFIRSCSSALPPSVMAELERTFDVPVIEAYGMTEGSHQIASNQLPPGMRKPGSVGVGGATQVAVFGPDGAPLSTGMRGEVGIRGAAVTAGYEGLDPAGFTFGGGWLRTGDEGYVDDHGYLWLTGRLKELINRGGEKVGPREVEEVLLLHPAVAEAVVFAVPDRLLGEEVAAAIVLKAGEKLNAAQLRAFASVRLGSFKGPRRVVFVAQSAQGPTGKAQRTMMAELLGRQDA